MATFIPEWGKVPGGELRVRSALCELDDDHIVRRPVRSGRCPADMFVQHLEKGWLAIALSSAGVLLDRAPRVAGATLLLPLPALGAHARRHAQEQSSR